MKYVYIHTILRVAIVLVLSTAGFAQTSAFSFQGRLNDGSSPANGRYDLQFKLFDAITGGNQIGTTLDKANTMLVNGVFSTALDFGSAVFQSGDRFIEISVRPNGSPNQHVILGGRQQILSVPFAVSAGTLQGQTPGDFIKNTTTAQSANFNILGNGLVGGNMGIGVNPQAGTKLDVAGNGNFRTANGTINLGSPNGETGIALVGTSRADVRFDGNKLRIVAGTGTGVPPNANGLTIATSGSVSIGSPDANHAPSYKLVVIGSDISGSDALYVQNRATAGGSAISAVNQEATGFAINAVGTVFVDGNIRQSGAFNGMVKAMLHVRPVTPTGNPTIVRCYNGVTGATTGTCGFAVTAVPGLVGVWKIDFGFDITTRIPSVTAEYGSGCNLITGVCGAWGYNYGANFKPFNSTALDIFTFDSGNSADTTPAAFVITLH